MGSVTFASPRTLGSGTARRGLEGSRERPRGQCPHTRAGEKSRGAAEASCTVRALLVPGHVNSWCSDTWAPRGARLGCLSSALGPTRLRPALPGPGSRAAQGPGYEGHCCPALESLPVPHLALLGRGRLAQGFAEPAGARRPLVVCLEKSAWTPTLASLLIRARGSGVGLAGCRLS